MSNRNNKRKKSTYRGPFQNNPQVPIHNVKKTMRTETDGPTVDAFSDMDTTTSINSDDELILLNNTKQKRPTSEKTKNRLISNENILALFFTLLSAGIGIIVYTHSNKFVAVEKDIEHINEGVKYNSMKIEKTTDKVIEIDKKIDLLKQTIDNKSSKK